MFREALEKELNSPNVENRLEALAKLRALSMTGAIPRTEKDRLCKQPYTYIVFVLAVFADKGGIYGMAERTCHGGHHGP